MLTERVADKLEAVGFFVPTDFAEREGDDPEPNSNEADILYALPPGSWDTTLVGIHRIMAHELQHVLSFAVKVRRAQANGGQGALEALWLDEGQSFDTPTLIEAWRTAPYLYDGRAATIEDMLKKHNLDDRHGQTSDLTDKQIKDLAEFVLSL